MSSPTIRVISGPTFEGPEAMSSTVRTPASAEGSSTTRTSVALELRCVLRPAGVYAGVRVTR